MAGRGRVVINLAWEFVVWLLAGVGRALGRADTEAREADAEYQEWSRIEGRR